MQKIINNIIPHPILSATLWLMWLLLNNTTDPAHIFLGLILALLIPKYTSSFWSRKLVSIKKTHLVFAFMCLMAYDIFKANINVAILILGPKNKLKPQFFEIPISAQNPYAIALLANCITLTPGTVSCKISLDNKILYVHGLNVDNPQNEIDTIKNRYEKRIINFFS